MKDDDRKIVVLDEGLTMEKLTDECACCTGAKGAFSPTPTPKE
jgi:hypothetical protein